jgi:transposase
MSSQELFPNLTIGLDLGDKVSRTCEIDAAGQVVRRAGVATSPGAIERYFGGRPRCRVVMEVGTHSPWISRQVKALGHEAVVSNTSEVYGKGRRKRRNDQLDAEFLARQGRADVELLHPIQHRSAQTQQKLEHLHARDQLIQVRTKLISHVRGAVKPLGARISKCDADVFAKRAAPQLPEALRPVLTPLLEVIADLTQRIRAMDRRVEQLIEEHPAAAHLQQPTGVGRLTALAYVLAVEDPKRFEHSRQAGAYFGLVPKLDESSDSSPQLHITKAGDGLVRRYLVSAAHYILGPFGPPCDLRRYGEAIAARGGKNAKKRAAVAVARKLAVLLHQLWVSQATYDPDWNQRRRAACGGAA